MRFTYYNYHVVKAFIILWQNVNLSFKKSPVFTCFAFITYSMDEYVRGFPGIRIGNHQIQIFALTTHITYSAISILKGSFINIIIIYYMAIPGDLHTLDL